MRIFDGAQIFLDICFGQVIHSNNAGPILRIRVYTCTFLHAIFQIQTVVFDKTGTVTMGRPDVTRICLYASNANDNFSIIIAILGTAESGSEHPLASAIVNYTKEVGNLIGRFVVDW